MASAIKELKVAFHKRQRSKLAGVLALPAGASSAAPAPGIVLCQGLSGVKHLVFAEHLG